NESKELMKFCRKFTVPLRAALREAGVLTNYETPKRPVVHVFFIAPGCCYTGYSYSNNNSPFYMGIPRLKFPSDAPSRSTLKLEEAFHVFIPADEWDERLANGMYAVDLGACPGGWTYQLVKRNMWVSSVDNGPMAQSLMDTGQVTWLREDGFRYRPNRNNISWMVCDMVEKPAKVAALMAQWLVNGWCRETIFNLKLPMKKRYEEVSQNLAYIQAQLDEHGVNAQIQARQLYHDREEVTVHVRRLWAAVGGRRDER
ncbi:TPA: 23S rRNA (cytidine(2498)-2'-O)-methyltransferase RlmM, partial [Klebsiella pneumoniae]|nr:23S rRNA (cytidine(2498)-2'-O)-methyltransferase RlmM [Klebsiella pneumoniae]